MVKAARPFVIIGTPGDRRVVLFQEALAGLDLPPASVIAYADLLENRVDLDAAIPRDAIVRIESPGKDWAVNRALALQGRELKTKAIAFPALVAAGDYIPSWAWYKGFRVYLEALEKIQKYRSDLVWMQSPRDILTMFDKWETHHKLVMHDIPTPQYGFFETQRYPVSPFEAATNPRISRNYFVKTRYGSSGTGMVATQTNPRRHDARYFTTLAMSGERLINTRKIRILSPADLPLRFDTAIQWWIDYERDNSHAETWIPKATVSGGAFDLRIVMIAGRMRHIVVRVSESPITNLHLLNKRGDFQEVRRRLSDAAWQRIEETCEQVAALFPNSLYMGVDLLITPTWNKHYVLEVNAFGDLLPNLLHEGEDTYTAEIREILKRD